MSTPMNDKAREAFEREYEAYCAPAEADWFRREEDDPDEYYHLTTKEAWWGFRAALQWAASQQAAEGWVLVPKEPTPEMCRALFRNLIHADDEAMVIKAVIAAAPPSTQGGAFLPGEYERMTENGRKAWSGVDPQSLRDGSHQPQGERDEQ